MKIFGLTFYEIRVYTYIFWTYNNFCTCTFVPVFFSSKIQSQRTLVSYVQVRLGQVNAPGNQNFEDKNIQTQWIRTYCKSFFVVSKDYKLEWQRVPMAKYVIITCGDKCRVKCGVTCPPRATLIHLLLLLFPVSSPLPPFN